MKNVIKAPMPDLNTPFNAKLLGKVVKAKRTQKGMTTTVAAERFGVSRNALLSIEKGSPNTQLETLLRVITSLGISLRIDVNQEAEEQSDEWY